MSYSLYPRDVKKVVDDVLAGRPYNKDQFLFYHLNRNHFNVKNEILSLKLSGEKKYIDNFGRAWELQANWKNYYHMPFGNWLGSVIGTSTPYSRKFLLDDTISGLDGEFEMIIRHDGKRIDALIDAAYQETYNFARTRNARDHKKVDVDPHSDNGRYAIRKDMGYVTVTG